MTRSQITMRFVLFVFLTGTVYCDYDCVCNYNVEKSVYLSASNQGQPIGYLYEFDCKQLLGQWPSSSTWITVAFEHQNGYIEKDGQTSSQICAGSPPDVDIVTTVLPKTTKSSTMKPTTTITSTTPTTTSATTTQTATTISTPSSTLKPTTTPTTTIPTMTSSTLETTITSSTVTPTTKLTTLTQTTPSTTTPTTTQTTVTSTSSTTSKQTTITTSAPTTHSSTMKHTTSSKKFACPLNIEQLAQREGSVVFVNQDNGKCYELIKFKRTWSFAENDCVNKGGHLTSIEDVNEENLLYGHVQSYGDTTWIGLNDKNSEEHFEWTSGEQYSYQSWQLGRKDYGTHYTDDCVMINSTTGKWDDVSCGSYHAYICKFDAVVDTGTDVSKLPAFTTPTVVPTTTTIVQSTTSISGQLSCPHDVVVAATNGDRGLLFVNGDTRKCYELVKRHRMWDNADIDCQKKGGHLVTIRNQMEEKLIYSYVKSYGHTVWIGLHDQNREEHFEWISGEPVTYKNWHQGRKDPYAHRFEDCVAMGPLTGTWDDMDCLYESYAYICEFAAVIGSQGPPSNIDGNTQLCSSTVQHLADRDNGILGQYERGCYELISNFKMSWQHGEDMCQSRGGHLAHISNAQQQSFIQSFLHRHSPQHAVWIGLHDTQIEGAFEWTAGTAVSYTNWIQGHTSNFESFQTEDCVAFIPYKNGKWDDVPCGNEYDLGETHPILCQYKIPLSPGIVG